MMKILTLYLPQFHEIPENNAWWGEGYTEWTAVRKAKSLYKGHKQPIEPLDGRYYDLVKDGVKTWMWQESLMKEYGIYGQVIYHYWFKGKLLLEKPMEILLQHPEIDIPFSICWANEPWARNWDGMYNDVLMPQDYGDESNWEKHFEYLLPFFKDSRYIKILNRPMVHIYKSKDIKNLEAMINCWNNLAKAQGFDGIYWVSAITSNNNDVQRECFDHYYQFEPGFTLKYDYGKLRRLLYIIRTLCLRTLNCFRSEKKVEKILSAPYTWKRIEQRAVHANSSPGSFISWDNTPRRGYKGTVYIGSSPKKFRKHMSVMKRKHPDAFIYINAWNEWGEGAHLEPDTNTGFEYLEAIRDVMNS